MLAHSWTTSPSWLVPMFRRSLALSQNSPHSQYSAQTIGSQLLAPNSPITSRMGSDGSSYLSSPRALSLAAGWRGFSARGDTTLRLSRVHCAICSDPPPRGCNEPSTRQRELDPPRSYQQARGLPGRMWAGSGRWEDCGVPGTGRWGGYNVRYLM